MKNLILVSIFAFALGACSSDKDDGKEFQESKEPSRDSSNVVAGQIDEDYIGATDPELGAEVPPAEVIIEKPAENPEKPVVVPPPVAEKPIEGMEQNPIPTNGISLHSFKVLATDGTTATKGKPIRINITLYNDDNTDATISLTPFLERTGLTDYTNLELPAISGAIAKKETKTFDLIVPVFFTPQKSTAQFALGSGPYKLNMKLVNGQLVKEIKNDPMAVFRIEPSRIVLTAFGYREAFTRTLDWDGRTPEKYMDYIVEGRCSVRQSNGSSVNAPRCVQDAGKFSYMAKPILVTQPANKDGVTMLREFETKLGLTKSGLDSRVNGHGFDKFVIYDNMVPGYMITVGNGILFENAVLTEQTALWANQAMITNLIRSFDRCTNYPNSDGTIGCANPPNGIFSASLAAGLSAAIDNLMKD